MSLPADWTQVPVTGTFRFRNGDPLAGKRITFESDQVVTIGGEVIVPKRLDCTLDDTGSVPAGFTLPSTNDPDLNVTGWAYTVKEKWPGGREYAIFVEADDPDDPTPIDLADVSPAVDPDALTDIETAAMATAVGVAAEAAKDAAEASATTATTKATEAATSAQSASDSAAAAAAATVFLQSGTGAVARTMQDKGRDRVSVKDFGAVGDGVTNDSAAFVAALATGAEVVIPAGSYLINDKIDIPSCGVLRGAGRGQTTLISGVIADSLFYTTASAANFIRISDMTISGNGLTGASGNGHAINFIDPAISPGSFTPQQAVLERLQIIGFKGFDKRDNSAAAIDSCGIILADSLQTIIRDVYVGNCGHGYYLYRAHNCKLENSAADGVVKACLVVYDCENVIVDKCDFVDGADGTPSTGYPTALFGSALVISYGNENFVLRDSKLKNTNGGMVIRVMYSNNDVLEGNWIRPDSLTDNVHKGIFSQQSMGLRIERNTFSPANTAFSQKYQMIEIYNTQANAPVSATIVGNVFGNVVGKTNEYNIKVAGNGTTVRFAGVSIRGNQFGWGANVAGACGTDDDILITNCKLFSSEIAFNHHYAVTNVTRTNCVRMESTGTAIGCRIGPNHFQTDGGTITNEYNGIVPSGSVSADYGDANAALYPGSYPQTNVWGTPLTINRAVNPQTTTAAKGDKFRIVRTAAATGAGNLTVNSTPSKVLTAGTWCEIEYNGSAWILTAAGSL